MSPPIQRNDAIRYLAVALAVGLFFALTAWLIRNEGRRTRESIREAAEVAGGEIRKGIVEGAERAVDKAGELPGKIARDIKQEVAGDGVSAVKSIIGEAGRVSREVLGEVREGRPEQPEKPEAEKVPIKSDASPPAPARPTDRVRPDEPQSSAEKPSQGRADSSAKAASPSVPPPPPENVVRQASQETPSPPPVAPHERRVPHPGPGKQVQRPEDPIRGLFDLGHQVTKAVDEMGQEILALSWEEERKVGREVHQMVGRKQKFVRSPAMVHRLEQLAQPILEQRARKEVSYSFTVLDDAEINAFAHAGGYVYVNKGLFRFAKTDAELQFFVAHEIAHIDLKHVVKRITYAARASEVAGEVGGTLAQMAYMAIALGYSKEDEFAADAWALRALVRLGRSREESLSVMKRMTEEPTKRQPEQQRPHARSVADKTLQQIEDHFRSHPPTPDRVKRLESLEIGAGDGAKTDGPP